MFIKVFNPALARSALLRSLPRVALNMDVHIVPVLEDNFSYILVDKATGHAAVVDPAEPAKVLDAIAKHRLKSDNIKAVLTTHHHWDHAGGNEAFVKRINAVQVYGGDDRIPALTKLVDHDETIRLGELAVRVLKNPCHTTGSVSYHVTSKGDNAGSLFTGDTLFVAGCGRFFEGTAAQMVHNMQNVYAPLPIATLVYPGHEYTVANLKFALSVEPANPHTKEKLDWSEAQRASGLPTVPSTIGEEAAINPFMRTSVPTIQAATQQTDPVEVMRVLRELKNGFKAST